mmetsp:Transcript_23561/g.82017  ORF Transcript_23561/g.82017 Transcript_23561/m.82017 type:complete len:225 (-) Transcript_23561:1294-1968(-)
MLRKAPAPLCERWLRPVRRCPLPRGNRGRRQSRPKTGLHTHLQPCLRARCRKRTRRARLLQRDHHRRAPKAARGATCRAQASDRHPRRRCQGAASAAHPPHQDQSALASRQQATPRRIARCAAAAHPPHLQQGEATASPSSLRRLAPQTARGQRHQWPRRGRGAPLSARRSAGCPQSQQNPRASGFPPSPPPPRRQTRARRLPLAGRTRARSAKAALMIRQGRR